VEVMGSNAALSVRGTEARVEYGEARAAAVRHLRVLPPVPAAYRAVPESGRCTPAARPTGPVVGRAASAGDGRQAPPLRLTARGRRVAVVLAVLLAMAVITIASALLGGGGSGLELMGTSSVVVEPGDTLWSLAGTVAGDRDVREVVDEIQLLNRLADARIEPGQVLRLP
jgi:nucleoid-associated protein YgaU